jgi:hypothetical protein
MKKLLSLLLVLCLLVLSLVACGGGESSSVSESESPSASESVSESASESESVDDGLVAYTVTVLYPDGTPAAGVYVQMCQGTSCQFPQPTDENGVFTVRQVPANDWEVKLPQLPQGYTTSAKSFTFDGNNAVTITLVAVTE